MFTIALMSLVSGLASSSLDTPTCSELNSVRALLASQTINDGLLETALSAYLTSHWDRVVICRGGGDAESDRLYQILVADTRSGFEQLLCGALGMQSCNDTITRIYGGILEGDRVPDSFLQSIEEILNRDPGLSGEGRLGLIDEIDMYWREQTNEVRLRETSGFDIFDPSAGLSLEPQVFYRSFIDGLSADDRGLSEAVRIQLQDYLQNEAPTPALQPIGVFAPVAPEQLRIEQLPVDFQAIQQRGQDRAVERNGSPG